MKRKSPGEGALKFLLIGIMLAFMGVFLIFPVCVVLIEALHAGLEAYLSTLGSIHSWTAIRLTLLVAVAVVPLNTLFGICAAWSVTHFHFRGKALLISLIEIPLWVSPVIGGLVFALIFGRQGWLGPWLDTHQIQILFAYPGIVLATAFCDFPFCGAGPDPADAVAGQQGGGSRADAGRERLAAFLAGGFSEDQVGHSLRGDFVQCAGHG